MPYYQESSDANFFALVHHVLENNRTDKLPERRDDYRREFMCQQFLAPYVGGRLPQESDFRRVLCYDLSPSGFSFLEPKPPESEYVIVALGTSPFIFLSAQIKRQEQVQLDGEPMYLLGCHFVARLTGTNYGRNLGEAKS